jgi:NAD(P)-dependent dehydrogenase (short-subunit alcohol dehydrogenase family)
VTELTEVGPDPADERGHPQQRPSALVTGASGGIGRAIAEQLTRLSARAVVPSIVVARRGRTQWEA